MTVNLTVSCDRDVAHLNWSSGGLGVTSIRLAQHCIYHDEHNQSTSQVSLLPYHFAAVAFKFKFLLNRKKFLMHAGQGNCVAFIIIIIIALYTRLIDQCSSIGYIGVIGLLNCVQHARL